MKSDVPAINGSAKNIANKIKTAIIPLDNNCKDGKRLPKITCSTSDNTVLPKSALCLFKEIDVRSFKIGF